MPLTRFAVALALVAGSAAIDGNTKSGMSAPLSEEGYMQVAGRKSDEEMKTYIRRVLHGIGREVVDEGQLNGFSRFYSGTEAVQSYGRLADELRTVSWAKAMAKAASTTLPPSVATPAKLAAAPAIHAQVAVQPTVASLVKQTASASPQQRRAPQQSAPTMKQTSQAPPLKVPSAPAHPVNSVQKVAQGVAVAPVHLAAQVSAAAPVHDATSVRAAAQAHSPAQFLAPTKAPEPTAMLRAPVLSNKTAAPVMLREIAPSAPKLNYTAAKGSLQGKELPAVDSVLHKASNTLEDFAAQAKLMQSRVLQQQAASRSALAEQKKKYEAKLAMDVHRINDTRANNGVLERKNLGLEAENKAAEKDADELQASIEIMRRALDKLGGKMDVAMAFISDSVNATDDRNAPDLAVLRPTTPEPNMEYFLGLARSELGLESNRTLDTQNGAILLQISQTKTASNVLPSMLIDDEDPAEAAERRMKAGKATPEDLVPLLSRSLDKIAKAEAAGIASMKAKFDLKHEANDKRLAALVNEQKGLEANGTALAEKKDALLQANEKLVETRDSLFQRLHGFQVFALKVDEAMAETLRAAEGMIN